MNQKGSTGLLVLIFVVLILAAAVMFFTRKNEGSDEPLPTPPSAMDGTGEPITVVGEVNCMPHKDQGIVETMECALGIRGAGGVYYGLLDMTPEYSHMAQLENGATVSVSGTLRDAPLDNAYVNVGVIEIQSVEAVGVENKL